MPNTIKHLKILLILVILPGWTLAQDYNIGERTFMYVDGTRNRHVKAECWYPTFDVDSLHQRTTELPFQLAPTIRNADIVDQTLPLIVISHGTGGNRFSLAWLAIELARNGYMVIAPDHYGNTYDNKIPEFFVRYWERPMDISFLLSSVLAEESISASIDTSRMGMMGFSFGGYTTLALAGVNVNCDLIKENAQTKEGKKEFRVPELGDLCQLIEEINCNTIPATFKDERLKCFVAMAPALGLGLPDKPIKCKEPVLIIGANNDKIAPLETNALKYHQQIPESEFLLLEGKIGHYVFLNEGNDELQKHAKRYYTDDKSVNRQLIHDRLTSDILKFLKANLK